MTFGQTLRAARHNTTLGQVSRRVGLSVPYLSDIELDRRHPPSDERIADIASAIGCDPLPLLVAAARQRGYVRVPVAGLTEDEIGDLICATPTSGEKASGET